MALEQSAWELMAIGMGLLKDREVLIDSARLLSIVVGQPKRTGNMRKSESALQIKAVSEEIETDSALDRELIIGYI